MAQTGYTPISIYYSATSTNVPTSGNLVAGELAINTADGKLFYKDSAGVVQVIGTKGGVGSSTTTQVLYNSSGLVVGSANMTFNGTTLTLANDASISGLTVGKGNGTDVLSTAVGSNALSTAYTGNSNTAIGRYALSSLTSGTNNNALGRGALINLTTGGFNVGVGDFSLQANTTASYNTAVGYNSSYSNTTGYLNTSVGRESLYTNTTGFHNTALGQSALYANTTGTYNIAVGGYANSGNTTGANNTSLGYQALNANTTASNNTAVGYQAGYSNTTGVRTTAFGYQAGYANTTGAANNFFGAYAGQYVTGSNNTSMGDSSQAGQSGLSTGNYNSSLGYAAMNSITTGSNNVAIGYYSLVNNSSASNNTAIGYQSLQGNTTGADNTALGRNTLNLNTTGYGNVCVGSLAGSANTTGFYNVYIGYDSGDASVGMTTGSGNIAIGKCNPSSAAGVNQIVIYGGTGTLGGRGDNTGFISPNGGGVYQGNNSTLWSITSDQRLKKNIVDNTVGLDAITKIQVRNFEYRTADEITDLPKSSAIDIKGVQLGPIAQELAQILPDCVKTESTGVMSVDASNITWYLVNAIKELKAEIDQLKGNK
jgi:hypothetical protein